jgi:hypothetical protein
MRSHSSLDGGKANSLVFTFTGQLLKEGDYGAPEPDFLQWLETSLFADVITASDTVEYDKLAKEEREAWKLFYDAIQATGNLLDLYKSNLGLFQKVAERLMFLPCFLSRHPDSQRFNRNLLENSRLSQVNMASACQPKGAHLARQSWPVRYAYAIIFTIDLTLDTYETRLSEWAEIYGYGIRHPIPLDTYEAVMERLGWDAVKRQQVLPKYQGHYRILPAWTKELEKLRRPFNEEHFLDYWHKGKEMILEEMPDFHLRPEWDDYRNKRAYKTGAKRGAIQHAIFKDILIALKTIAGANKKHGGQKSRLR